MKFRYHWLALILLVPLAACPPAEDPPDVEPPPAEPPPEPAEPPDDEPGLTRCTNEDAGYSVAYPDDWRTNPGTVMASCQLFDPEPFEVPERTDIPLDIAVVIQVELVAFDQVVDPDFGERNIERAETRVAGRRAERQLAEGTGEAFLPEGLRVYRYYVDWGSGTTLIGASHDVGEPTFEAKREALDRMMETLRRQ